MAAGPPPRGRRPPPLVQTQPRAQRPRSVANWQALLPALEAMPEVAAVSPMVAGAGLALRGEAQRARSRWWASSWTATTASSACAPRWCRARPGWGRAKPSSAASWPTTWACAWATG
jgi:hypothetical protein